MNHQLLVTTNCFQVPSHSNFFINLSNLPSKTDSTSTNPNKTPTNQPFQPPQLTQTTPRSKPSTSRCGSPEIQRQAFRQKREEVVQEVLRARTRHWDNVITATEAPGWGCWGCEIVGIHTWGKHLLHVLLGYIYISYIYNIYVFIIQLGKFIATSLFFFTGMVVSEGNHPQYSLNSG